MLGLTPSYAQKYLQPSNKYMKETVKGVSFTYKDGYIVIKNNSKYNLEVLNIYADYSENDDINGMAFFEDIKKGTTQKLKMNFSTFKNDKEIDYKKIKPELLILSYFKAVRSK
ncbi:hypothetical protein B0A62_10545 [Flavobacterium hydatis]|uniref:Uncharacterized protein n=2 Tax=Flavobacterium hydatis TaxID=991 RepID=A0A086ALL6_FLAHY|nr:hypothetical protein IW20_07730 [Flavobacterium hydatis]OXA94617.1 hypothetical protein B0A62_10545 [Flavobacterium hydatis]